MVAVRKWMTEATTPLVSGNLNPPAKMVDESATSGWRKPLKVACQGRGPPNPTQPVSAVVVDGGGGSRVGGSASQASPKHRPNNPFSVLGDWGRKLRLLMGQAAQSTLNGPDWGQAGWATPLASVGSGPGRPRKQGLNSSKVKGKGLALPESSMAAPDMEVGRSVFHFSPGVGEDSSTQPAVPPACASLPSSMEQHMQFEGDSGKEVVRCPPAAADQVMRSAGGPVGQDVCMEGKGVRGPADHEEAVACTVRAIMIGVEDPQGGSSIL